MKTFITAFVLATTVVAAQAQAGSFGPSMDTLTRTLIFPDQVSQPVTKDQIKPTK
ncbi:hypothetical protein [Ruegeria sp. R14_0]|uniref:hypothetical protein n=1 Tax=Ruegeria sp. R14_0 TaxID=2821100 RepID=UPI001ADBFBE6|nr:hypothetical protein [Ruegeria sp. R14_0]MBO9446629.1 hypothetical protein [Ruegeria sp. R14_0]